MKTKILLLFSLILSGCLNTQNRKIEMKSKPTGEVSSINSGITIEANPKDSIEREVEYFEHHSVRWPDEKKSADPAPPDELEKLFKEETY